MTKLDSRTSIVTELAACSYFKDSRGNCPLGPRKSVVTLAGATQPGLSGLPATRKNGALYGVTGIGLSCRRLKFTCEDLRPAPPPNLEPSAVARLIERTP